MLFNSLPYLFFLPVVFVLYWASPVKIRWVVLLILSYYFYLAASPQYVLLLLFTTFVTWQAGKLIHRSETDRSKKAVLACTLLIIFGLLAFFKYCNFLIESVTGFLRLFSFHLEPHLLKILMPAGISFYTFMTASYLIDIYKGKTEPQENFAKYALYVSFFPQIIAGPIGRTNSLMPQLFEKREFDPEKASYGLRLMLWGLFKKLIIADGLVKYVDHIFAFVPYYFGMTFIMAAIMYSFQIYCDFSGYSDIAIGTAKLLNIDLMTNFRSPYLSRSIREFWSRWHISLSTWFRDYVYIPLGGNRKGKVRKSLNQLITMLVSGLWHGANWTFVLWGGLHGVYQIVEGAVTGGSRKQKVPEDKPGESGKLTAGQIASNVFHCVLTLGLVTIAWIFFRADSISDAFFILTHLHNGVIFHFGDAWVKMMSDMGLKPIGIVKLVASISFLLYYDFVSLKKDIPAEMAKWKPWIRWGIYIGLTCLIIISKLHGGTTQSFIYFNF